MGIPLLDGRYFNIGNRSVSTPVVILNESMAKRCWPGQRAIGKRFHVGGPQMKLPWATVVGVVADTKMGSRDEPSEDQWYTPMELWSSPRLRTALVKPESSVTLSVDT